MCYQVIELYSACRCLYYQHAIDPCSYYGRPGHHVQTKTILVGYACSDHSSSRGSYAYSGGYEGGYSDSGYYSGGQSSSSSRHSSSRSGGYR